MGTLVRPIRLRYRFDNIIIGSLFILFLSSCSDTDEREKLLPGRYVVTWDKSIFTEKFTIEQVAYYSDLTLAIYPDRTYQFNFDFDNNGQTEGDWRFEGAKYQKFLELRVRKNYWVQIGVCRDVGQIFTYPLQELDTTGQILRLTFKKTENFH